MAKCDTSREVRFLALKKDERDQEAAEHEETLNTQTRQVERFGHLAQAAGERTRPMVEYHTNYRKRPNPIQLPHVTNCRRCGFYHLGYYHSEINLLLVNFERLWLEDGEGGKHRIGVTED